ncbi:unnamed protein product [Ilex paraguariensis]|uniref:Uncharacterized protein n=1 Tax=Ilex paraguariensis TaxID=185542 RepID=A0ABC8RGW1_9AQUA
MENGLTGPDGNASLVELCSVVGVLDRFRKKRIKVDQLDGAHYSVTGGSDAHCLVANLLVEMWIMVLRWSSSSETTVLEWLEE